MGFGFSRGNVLFLILLAVALFATLSYAVTQSNRSGGNDISKENRSLLSSEIIQYSTSVGSAVQRLQLVNGCKNTQVSFAADSDGDGVWFDTDDAYHNPNAPTDLSCHIFHPNGGGLPSLSPPDNTSSDGRNYTFSHRNQFINIGTTGPTDGTAHDLTFYFIMGDEESDRAMCVAMNNILGIDNPAGNPPEELDILSLQRFVGVYEAGLGSCCEEATELVGKFSGCFREMNATANYTYYNILIPR